MIKHGAASLLRHTCQVHPPTHAGDDEVGGKAGTTGLP